MPPPLSSRDLRKFGLLFASLVVALFALAIPWLWSRPFPLWPWVVAGPVAILALLYPPGLRWFYFLWMKLGEALGFINTRLLLFVVFFLVVLPVALVMKITGRDPMARRIDPDAVSYRVPSSKKPASHLERPY
jgi:hypothetical protein